MDFVFVTALLDVFADGQRDAEGVAVLQRDGRFDADQIRRRHDMVVVRRHGGFHHLQRRHVRAAIGYETLVMRHQLIACARAANRAQLVGFAELVQRGTPQFRIAQQLAVRRVHQAFRDGDDRNLVRDARKHVLREPVDAERTDAADDERRAFDGLVHFFHLIVFDALREGTVEFQMLVRLPRMVDDLAVQRRSDETDFMSVLPRGKRQCRPHHAGTDNRHNAHDNSFLIHNY